jgi:hypothetical protein
MYVHPTVKHIDRCGDVIHSQVRAFVQRGFLTAETIHTYQVTGSSSSTSGSSTGNENGINHANEAPHEGQEEHVGNNVPAEDQPAPEPEHGDQNVAVGGNWKIPDA